MSDKGNTFKVDGKVVKAGEVRVEVELLDGASIVVILTNEGIITDCFSSGVHIETSSVTYDEKFGQMTFED